jgi:hypothetical protein
MKYPVDSIIDNMREANEEFACLWLTLEVRGEHYALIDAILDAFVDNESKDDDEPDDGSEDVPVYLSKEDWLGDAFSRR